MAQLKANNIVTSEISGFNRNGTAFRAERVTFYVGANGPFTKDFPAGQDNTQAIQQYIDQVVQAKNQLAQRYAV